jgi:hypothetical protein
VSNYLAIEDYIYRHPKINEVILSGGDPLSLSDEKLAPQQANFLHPSMAQSRSPASQFEV